MNRANDLFLLLLNLAQMHSRSRIMALFLESLGALFAPLTFAPADLAPVGTGLSFPIATRTATYGHIVLTEAEPLSVEEQTLIHNAIQMLAVILERLDFEEKLAADKSSVEQLASKRLDQLTASVDQLRQSRNAYINLVEDLTQEIETRRQAEAAVQESHEQFSLFMRHSPIHAYIKAVTATESRVLQASDSLHQMLGLSVQEIVGKTMTELFPAEMAAKFTADDWAVVNQGEVLKLDESLHGRSYATIKFPLVLGAQTLLAGYTIDITERKQAEAAVQMALREKEALLREIHHRVKNNLQVITSLLRLQSRQVENIIAKAALLDMVHRIHSMAMIHEHLYRSDDLGAVDLAAYLRSLCTQLCRALVVTPGAVRLVLDLSPMRLGIDQAIPCGLLVNELVSNAFKHAYPAGRTGEVRVSLQPVADGPAWRLCVADDGVGLPAGFDVKQLTSLGLQLVTDLTRQIGGTLEIGTGPGAQFAVVFQDRRG
jgi:PAS domain S-box-containing protein